MNGDEKKRELSTEPYKGVRDFYPKEMFVEKYIFGIMQKTAESYGYEEYGASVLEPTELFRTKSGDEIVNEQTYSFVDRGGREVTLRPEMTPTVARMIAAIRREIPLPARWYSIENFFRYERPQKGRLREHYQLNADIFGVSGMEAEAEVLSLARKILLNFGLKDENFKIRINDRNLLRGYLSGKYGLSEEKISELQKLLDKKDRMTDFDVKAREIAGADFSVDGLAKTENLEKIISKVRELGGQIEFDPYLVRGFDYYTGTVFEIYDTGSENKRSILGGGRYDNLLSIFGAEKLPAVGFGMGDVTAKDILETYGLLPAYKSPALVEICPLREEFFGKSADLAEHFRSFGLSVSANFSSKNLGDKIRASDKRMVPYIIPYGDNEAVTGRYKLKNLSTGEEFEGDISEVAEKLKKASDEITRDSRHSPAPQK